MNEDPSTQATPPPPSGRRNAVGMLFGVMLFYLAVFAAIDLVGFRFPMPVLVTYFFVVAIPFGLFVAGSLYFVYLLRLQFARTTAAKPTAVLLISAFIGTTVIATSYFVIVYPDWKRSGIESWRATIETMADPELPEPEVRRLAADVTVLVSEFTDYFERSDMDGIEANQPLVTAFQSVVSAITDGRIDAEEFARLREVVPARATPATEAVESPPVTTSTPTTAGTPR